MTIPKVILIIGFDENWEYDIENPLPYKTLVELASIEQKHLRLMHDDSDMIGDICLRVFRDDPNWGIPRSFKEEFPYIRCFPARSMKKAEMLISKYKSELVKYVVEVDSASLPLLRVHWQIYSRSISLLLTRAGMISKEIDHISKSAEDDHTKAILINQIKTYYRGIQIDYQKLRRFRLAKASNDLMRQIIRPTYVRRHTD